jgi:hypothetical protein
MVAPADDAPCMFMGVAEEIGGILFRSDESMVTLRSNFRTNMDVAVPDGRRVLLRFWYSRVVRDNQSDSSRPLVIGEETDIV